MSLEIRRSLVLSVTHLTPELRAAIDAGTFTFNVSWDHGWEAYVGEDIEDDDVDVTCVNAAFALARTHECTWIVFDQDGPIISELPHYAE